MMCHYSTRGRVSRGKRDGALNPGAAERDRDTSDVATGTVIVGRSCVLSESLSATPNGAHAIHV
jgi:hypothetical protein